MGRRKPVLLHVCAGLEMELSVYTSEQRGVVAGQIISMLRRKNRGRQIKGTKRLVEDGLCVAEECNRVCLEKGGGIPVSLCFQDEELAALAEMYACAEGLREEVDAICRGTVIPNFASGTNGQPKLFVFELRGIGMVGVWRDVAKFYEVAAATVARLHKILGSNEAIEQAADVIVEHARSLRPNAGLFE